MSSVAADVKNEYLWSKGLMKKSSTPSTRQNITDRILPATKFFPQKHKIIVKRKGNIFLSCNINFYVILNELAKINIDISVIHQFNAAA